MILAKNYPDEESSGEEWLRLREKKWIEEFSGEECSGEKLSGEESSANQVKQ
jgi:hypothetical protein